MPSQSSGGVKAGGYCMLAEVPAYLNGRDRVNCPYCGHYEIRSPRDVVSAVAECANCHHKILYVPMQSSIHLTALIGVGALDSVLVEGCERFVSRSRCERSGGVSLPMLSDE